MTSKLITLIGLPIYQYVSMIVVWRYARVWRYKNLIITITINVKVNGLTSASEMLFRFIELHYFG